MREILFRGKSNWDDGKVKKGDWLYGMTIHPHCTTDTEITSYYIGLGNKTIDGKTLGQYTGLTDKNGTKIFEGDIVQLTDIRYNNEWKAVVVFGNPYCQYSWGWNLQYIGKKPQINTDILLWVEMEDVQVYCEVIGTIHDNPELLESEVQGE